MVKFIPVKPEDIPNFRESHRGRVSYPILKAFLETGEVLVQVDREGVQQSLQGLNSSLGAYIKSHNLPIKLFNRGGELYLMRTDTDDEGDVLPLNLNNYGRVKEDVGISPPELLDRDDIPTLDAGEVATRFDTERNQTTK
jgi:hypothetical protein